METDTVVATNAALTSGLYKYRKNSQKKGFGSIPTLVESVVFENPVEELEPDVDHFHEYEDIVPMKPPDTNKGRRNSLGVLPKTRRGSLGLTSLLGLKNRPDPSPGRDGSYIKNDDIDVPALPPRRSSIAVPNESKGRRKSWATRLQVERKRQHSGGDDDAILNGKSNGRRPSWWNVLVPENILKSRSRRASQQLSRSDESITQLPYRRSKSRSVDHGFAAPFDLDSLRSKVEGRFDSVQKDEEEQVKRIPVPPIKTTTYSVRDRDTLTSVAARFDTTPSELTKINRLATNFIFPGQNLLVPDKGQDGGKEGDTPSEGGEGSDTSSQNAASQEKDFLDTLRPVSPDPPTSPAAPQRFLKINVRHITDGQGVVSGVLLVTPNAVMFDPNVSDTLVLEHGPESYGVIAPMEFVVNAAIYYDIAHMRTHDVNPNLTRGEKPEIYYMNKPNSPDKDSLVKDETFPELATTGDNDSSDATCEKEEEEEGEIEEGGTRRPSEPPGGERGGDAFPKAFDQERVTPTSAQVYSDADIVLSQDWVPPVSIVSAVEPPLSAPPAPSDERVRKQAVSFSLDTTVPIPPSTPDKKNKMLKRLSYPLSWMEGLAGDNSAGSGGGGSSGGSQGDSLPTSADSHNSGSVFSKVFNRRSSYGGFGKSESVKKSTIPPPRLDYRSMVSVDDMPELFASFDKLIPRPARSCDDPPLYLRLRMGRPTNRAVPRSTPLMSYGRKRMRPEYWFSVPRNRVDDLYKFLNHWVPELYGELGDVTQRGYTLVDSDTELWDEETTTPGDKGERSDSQGDMGDLTRESWEVLSMSDELRRALYSSGASVDLEFCPPDLIGTTEILTMEHREKLCSHLPARAQGYMWSLVFSSSQNGFSLNSLYRKMQRVDSPLLLIIQDTENNVFGALTSCALHPSEHFYGTGESFLYSFCARRAPASPVGPAPIAPPPLPPPVTAPAPSADQDAPPPAEGEQPPPEDRIFRVWQWTGDNLYFIRGSNDNISIGAGDGKFGLWLDGDLYQGRTQSCTTYGNEPLSTQEDFIVKILECWAFI